jgi:hypothetical protein
MHLADDISANFSGKSTLLTRCARSNQGATSRQPNPVNLRFELPDIAG